MDNYNHDGSMDFFFADDLCRLKNCIANDDESGIEYWLRSLDTYRHEKIAPQLVEKYKAIRASN